MRERLDQLGAVSHLITRCKWNRYTCLIFSGSRNVRLAQDGIKQHCQRKWTQGFLSYFTSYWVTVTIYFTAVGRLVWKCSVMPLRMEGESRKKCEGYCSDEALYLFLSSVTKLYCLNKARLFIRIFLLFMISLKAFRFDWVVYWLNAKVRAGKLTVLLSTVILCTLDNWATDLPREGFGLTNPDDPYPYQMCHPGHTKKAQGDLKQCGFAFCKHESKVSNSSKKYDMLRNSEKVFGLILHSCHYTPMHTIRLRAKAS